MYIATNRFKVSPAQEEAFQQRWLNREVLLKACPGFVSFQFLEGPRTDDEVLYVSHTVWKTEEDFLGWTQSEQFRRAHASAGKGPKLTLGAPVFEGFKVRQYIEAS